MNLSNPTAEIYIPDQVPPSEALGRTTHLCIAAHQDDIEIMAAQPIIECFTKKDHWFTGIVLADGRGSPRHGFYQHMSDEEMRSTRMQEQRKAAFIGNYAALIFLDYPSSEIKDATNKNPVEDIIQILRATKLRNIYTHNLADKHDTHVATALRVIQAIRLLPKDERPENLLGCEVWRNLDWLDDKEKIALNLTDHDNLQMALLGVFDSQISGGKRYDIAAMARRTTNATFFESHGLDKSQRLTFAMNLTPLIQNDNEPISNYILGFIDQFSQDVKNRLEKYG